jgi:hypothetical protein
LSSDAETCAVGDSQTDVECCEDLDFMIYLLRMN